MEEINKVLVFSKVEFDQYCYENNWYDKNVENLKNYAFISIIGTKYCSDYDSEKEFHWFKKPHHNVLNLEFDDVEYNEYGNECLYKAMDKDDANNIIDFIDNNIGKTFIIHCMAGKSRSQAIFRFITDMYFKVYDGEICGRKDNPCFTPNMHVVRLLKRTYYDRYGLFNYNENNF